MVSLRDIFSPLVETSGAARLRHWLTLRRALRDDIGTRTSAQHRNLEILQTKDLVVPTGSGRTAELFILGTGPSVLELTAANKERMRAGTTVGLNSWALHDFVPDAYSFEEMEDDNYVPVARGLSTALDKEEVKKAKPLIFHLRSRLSTPPQRLVAIPPELQTRIRYYGRVNPETRKIRNLESDLVSILEAHRSGGIAPHVMIDSGMSVARMVSLGILRQFKTIVLVGVDLNTPRYFFEEDPSYLARHNLADFNPWISRSKNHDTEETKNRHFSASDFLPALARAAETVSGVEVYVGSANSKLSRDLRVFSW